MRMQTSLYNYHYIYHSFDLGWPGRVLGRFVEIHSVFLMNNCASFLFDWIWKIIVEWCDIVRCRWCCFCICFIFSLQSLALQSGMTQTEVRRLLCEWFCLSLALSAVNVITDLSIHYLQLKCWLNLFFLINYIHPFLLCISWFYY